MARNPGRYGTCSKFLFEVLELPVLTGKIGKIGGIDSYIATPSTDYPKDAAIIFLTDVFGYMMPNAQVRLRLYDKSSHRLLIFGINLSFLLMTLPTTGSK